MTTAPNPQDDKELLELAARAAGMDYLVWTPGVSPLVPGEKRINGQMVWNPIHDDGDALRLAVKLGMGVLYETQPCGRIVEVSYDINEDEGTCKVATDLLGTDPYAATRRAIVRAAAAIARQESSQ